MDQTENRPTEFPGVSALALQRLKDFTLEAIMLARGTDGPNGRPSLPNSRIFSISERETDTVTLRLDATPGGAHHVDVWAVVESANPAFDAEAHAAAVEELRLYAVTQDATLQVGDDATGHRRYGV
jgi:hypothetical protein